MTRIHHERGAAVFEVTVPGEVMNVLETMRRRMVGMIVRVL